MDRPKLANIIPEKKKPDKKCHLLYKIHLDEMSRTGSSIDTQRGLVLLGARRERDGISFRVRRCSAISGDGRTSLRMYRKLLTESL